MKKLVLVTVLTIGAGCFAPTNNTERGASQGGAIGAIRGGVI